MPRPFTVLKGGLSAMGQAPRPTPISASEVDYELAARRYIPGVEPGVPEPVHEPGLDLPPLLMPELHVPYKRPSPYAKYIRFLPYLVVLFQDRSIFDFGKIV